MSGWIKLHREIQKHWIFNDADRLKAWISILLEVNHSDNKVVLGDTILICKRGESLHSLDKWAVLFGKNWNKSKTRRFFKLLEADAMIVLKSERITTRLTVCNYDTYQDDRNADETQVKRKRNASETQVTPNKNDKNDKNYKNDKEVKTKSLSIFKQNLSLICKDEKLVDEYVLHRKKVKAVDSERAWNGFEKEVNKSEFKIDEILVKCLEKGWKGFEAEWLQKDETQKTNNYPSNGLSHIIRDKSLSRRPPRTNK